LRWGAARGRFGALSIVQTNFMTASPSCRRGIAGFTLIELLTVIAIIAILASLILASLVNAKERAKRINCLNNLRQMNIAVHLYADDYQEKLPPGTADSGNEYPPIIPTNTWQVLVRYTGSPRVVGCPNLPPPFKLGGYPMEEHGYVLGFIYLAGHQKLKETGTLARYGWETPMTINDTSSLPLMADLNVWTPSGGQTVAPHGPTGAIYLEGDPTNPAAGGRPSKVIGAAGGNVALLDGSVSWRPIHKMVEHQMSLVEDELLGAW
jgi:prepilin-type N-terminal cleavage/methylation domain-containing protein